MLTEHVNIMKLLDMAEEIVGRKKFQKVVYIGKQLGMPFQEKYGFHMYGPYSEELSVRLDELKQFGFVSEVKEEKAAIANIGTSWQSREHPSYARLRLSKENRRSLSLTR